MAKLLTMEVECCYDCPHYDSDFQRCNKAFRNLGDHEYSDEIPSWCPLPDALGSEDA